MQYVKPKSPSDSNAPVWARWKTKGLKNDWYWFENLPKWSKRLNCWYSVKGESCPAK